MRRLLPSLWASAKPGRGYHVVESDADALRATVERTERDGGTLVM